MMIAMLMHNYTLKLRPNSNVHYKVRFWLRSVFMCCLQVTVTLQIDGGLWMQPKLREQTH